MDRPVLHGGRVSEVRRVGDTVVRSQGTRAPFVHALLDFLAGTGWAGAPRVRSVDHRRREETLTFIDGVVPWRPPVPDWALTDTALASLARLVRQLHDLTAGTGLAEPGEVVCHHDLAPGNTVYRPSPSRLAPVAFVDWDLAGPGRRVEDVAHVCWQWLDLGPAVPDVEQAARRIGVIADAYGGLPPSELVTTALWWQDRCWRGIETAAACGDPAMLRLVRDGVPGRIRDAHVWTQAHQHRLAPNGR